ncbi:hypothetical protein OAO10_02450 [Luminiphilus sp.]|nr:hypothetical protein [Luminiphilus sp.]
MSEHESNIEHYLDAIRSISAVKLAEIGGSSSALTERLIGDIDWATQVQIHALMEFKDAGEESVFDSVITDAGKQTSVHFELNKYEGSETEKLDAIMEAAEFDAVYVSWTSSAESLLGALMCCHESLRSGGVIAIDPGIGKGSQFASAITSFYDMYRGNYKIFANDESHIFVKS